MENDYLKKYTEVELRSCQLKQLEILKIFDRICKKHNLRYWIEGGTLLGAVRHKGFIPWDDDLDVAMPSEDYKKLDQIIQSELPDHLFWQTKKTDPTMIQDFAKIRDMNSFYVEFGDDFVLPYQKGIYIDIFEMKEYPKLPKKLMSFLIRKISKSHSVLRSKKYINFHTLIEIPYFFLILCILSPIWKFLSLCFRKHYISYGFYENVGGWFFLKEDIYPLSQIEFEDEKFFAPYNFDNYLKILYGKYMELPPKEDRISHAVYIHTNLYK